MQNSPASGPSWRAGSENRERPPDAPGQIEESEKIKLTGWISLSELTSSVVRTKRKIYPSQAAGTRWQAQPWDGEFTKDYEHTSNVQSMGVR